jgi:anti-sigma B factor antagonist
MAIEFAAWEEEVDDTTQVVAVRGEIDLFTAPEFKARIHEAIDAGRDLVVVDLSATTFIDSSSLGVLIAAHRRMDMHGGRLVVACDVPAVLSTFKITGLDAVIDMVKTREAALASGPDGASPAERTQAA